jgi:hypothetical protein
MPRYFQVGAEVQVPYSVSIDTCGHLSYCWVEIGDLASYRSLVAHPCSRELLREIYILNGTSIRIVTPARNRKYHNVIFNTRILISVGQNPRVRDSWEDCQLSNATRDPDYFCLYVRKPSPPYTHTIQFQGGCHWSWNHISIPRQNREKE